MLMLNSIIVFLKSRAGPFSACPDFAGSSRSLIALSDPLLLQDMLCYPPASSDFQDEVTLTGQDGLDGRSHLDRQAREPQLI